MEDWDGFGRGSSQGPVIVAAQAVHGSRCRKEKNLHRTDGTSQTNALPVQGFRKRWLLALSHIITQIQLIALATSMNNDTGCSETGQLCQLLRLGAGNCISCSSSEGLCLASEAEVDSTRDLPPAKLPDMPEPPDCVKPQSTASPPETKACRLPASQTQQKSQKRG